MDEKKLEEIGFVFCKHKGREAYHYFGKNRVFTARIERNNHKPYYAVVHKVGEIMKFENPTDPRNGKYSIRWLTDEHNPDKLKKCMELNDN
ncbi:hypothetical protein [Dysgonomonas gadei]|uniref:hypothetical protein n=1 Tax=Dysgonomonas gadei TaxID=156974 RepID=UPI003AF09004